ncbi:SMC-Scp complex subunit ScpB [Gilvimarinus chinensis]|uniref:SMC-Scp complex subunit ScpB n=1 Tax=Gilvimarinus chinensis TaxID=396005 RepID=UPI0003625C9A|nr:SMC-Scp complex subunit ScpB [Gilvimarinus chinensis]
MEIKQLQAIVEGALLAAGEPLSLKRLETLFEEGEQPTKEQFSAALEAIAEACGERGFELKEVASGWRLQVREELAPWVNRLWEEKPQKYSRALLETLALIAYRQPITRGDIEEIRGVAVSSHIIKTLTERDWVKVVGQRDVPGRPSLYATTRQFLDYFNLKSLDELPTLSEIRDFDEINNALDLGNASDTNASVGEKVHDEDDAEPTDQRADEGESDESVADPSVGHQPFAESDFSAGQEAAGSLLSESDETRENELSINPETTELEEVERND